MSYTYVDIIKENLSFPWSIDSLPYVVYRTDIVELKQGTPLSMVIDLCHVAAFVHELDARNFCSLMNSKPSL